MADRKPLTFRGTLRGISSPAVRPIKSDSGSRTMPRMPESGAFYLDKTPATPHAARFVPVADARYAARPMPGAAGGAYDFTKDGYEPDDACISIRRETAQDGESQFVPRFVAPSVNDGTPLVELSELILPSDSLEQLCDELIDN